MQPSRRSTGGLTLYFCRYASRPAHTRLVCGGERAAQGQGWSLGVRCRLLQPAHAMGSTAHTAPARQQLHRHGMLAVAQPARTLFDEEDEAVVVQRLHTRRAKHRAAQVLQRKGNGATAAGAWVRCRHRRRGGSAGKAGEAGRAGQAGRPAWRPLAPRHGGLTPVPSWSQAPHTLLLLSMLRPPGRTGSGLDPSGGAGGGLAGTGQRGAGAWLSVSWRQGAAPAKPRYAAAGPRGRGAAHGGLGEGGGLGGGGGSAAPHSVKPAGARAGTGHALAAAKLMRSGMAAKRLLLHQTHGRWHAVASWWEARGRHAA